MSLANQSPEICHRLLFPWLSRALHIPYPILPYPIDSLQKTKEKVFVKAVNVLVIIFISYPLMSINFHVQIISVARTSRIQEKTNREK